MFVLFTYSRFVIVNNNTNPARYLYLAGFYTLYTMKNLKFLRENYKNESYSKLSIIRKIELNLQ